MDNVYLIILFLLLLLPFVVMSLLFYLKLSGRKKEDKKALQSLIEQVTTSAPEHKKAVAEFLATKAGVLTQQAEVRESGVRSGPRRKPYHRQFDARPDP